MIEVNEMQKDASGTQQECRSSRSGGKNDTRPEVANNIDTDLQLIAESFQKACRTMNDSGKEQHEIVQIIKKMAAIAKEICLLSDHQVPTMRKL
jgi:hypothetical protein